MAKYNSPITLTKRDEKYIRDELRDYIDGNLCDELNYAHDTETLPAPVKQLMNAAVDKLYPGFVKLLIKDVADEIDITQDAVDKVFYYDPLLKAVDKIVGRRDVQVKSDEDSRARRILQLEHDADRLGMKVVPDES